MFFSWFFKNHCFYNEYGMFFMYKILILVLLGALEAYFCRQAAYFSVLFGSSLNLIFHGFLVLLVFHVSLKTSEMRSGAHLTQNELNILFRGSSGLLFWHDIIFMNLGSGTSLIPKQWNFMSWKCLGYFLLSTFVDRLRTLALKALNP